MKINEMMYVGMFAALVAVLGYLPAIPIPLSPVPITAQTLGVMLAGSVLGSRLGGLSMIILVLLAIVGAPVLQGGQGGIGHILGPSGGYIISWPVAAFVIGWLTEKKGSMLKLWQLISFNILGGIIIVYLIGMPYFAFAANFTFKQTILFNVNYIPGDLMKAVVASVIALQLQRAYPLNINSKKRAVNQIKET